MAAVVGEFVAYPALGKNAERDADHHFTTPGARDRQADIITGWIEQRWP